jgi:hypothetical protein
VVTGAIVEGKRGQSAPASLTPQEPACTGEGGLRAGQLDSRSYGNVQTEGLRGLTASGVKSREGHAGYKKSGLMPGSEGMRGRIREDEAIRRGGANPQNP